MGLYLLLNLKWSRSGRGNLNHLNSNKWFQYVYFRMKLGHLMILPNSYFLPFFHSFSKFLRNWNSGKCVCSITVLGPCQYLLRYNSVSPALGHRSWNLGLMLTNLPWLLGMASRHLFRHVLTSSNSRFFYSVGPVISTPPFPYPSLLVICFSWQTISTVVT